MSVVLHFKEGLWFDVCWYLPPYTNKDPGSLRQRKQKLAPPGCTLDTVNQFYCSYRVLQHANYRICLESQTIYLFHRIKPVNDRGILYPFIYEHVQKRT